MYRLPVGNENFSDFREFKLDFVDKTLLIKELLDNPTPQIVLITRPRRFGKTLNLSMLEHFFAPQAYGRPTAGLFDGLKISQCGEEYMCHRGYEVYDVMLIPKDQTQLGLILEFKTVRDSQKDLKQVATEALQQIKDRSYATELQQKGIEKMLSLRLAFRGKQVEILTD